MPQASVSRQVRRYFERRMKKMQKFDRRAFPNRVFHWDYPDRDEKNRKVPLPWATAHLYETCRKMVIEWAGQGASRVTKTSFTAAQNITNGVCGVCYQRYRMGL